MLQNNIMELIGYIGSIMLAVCGLPQALESFKTKSSEGLTWGFIGLWFFGEIFTFIYILPKMDLPLLINYSANIIFLAVIIYYKIKPRK
jgi:uncharacterized protein with PQ loop repeat